MILVVLGILLAVVSLYGLHVLASEPPSEIDIIIARGQAKKQESQLMKAFSDDIERYGDCGSDFNPPDSDWI